MDGKPFKIVAGLLLATQILATVLWTVFSALFTAATVPSWISCLVIIVVAARMFFQRDLDNSLNQQIVMVCCLFAASVDLFWAWAWVDSSIGDSANNDWAWAFPQIVAAIVAIYAAKKHFPSNVMDDRRQFTAYLLLVTHGVCFFFGTFFYPGYRWVVYVAGALISVRLFTATVEDENIACGMAMMVLCIILAAADLWIVYWCLTGDAPDDDAPRKWILVFPNAAAALGSMYTAVTLMQDRRLLTNILVTV